jgi:hypothetical protein
MSSDTLKNHFIAKYLAVGPHKFFNFILVHALNKLVLMEKGTYKGNNPDLEFLEYYDKLIILYRREGDENFLEIARLFRKAAHKIYRIMLKKKLTPYNGKFLNLVKKCQ